ncbi:spore protease YyaC [Radiobacillus kanasensis]|uniref:spore protease YyaC n=1 Tax=Radiobacillus kanasensis TaxID=2844358 RepID=UPI001E52D4D4|nr:spore protease YyaC [Radiobacillus kanasensis]UFT99415.1 spore protease YyaC [Radiobacillus kanasensis]
MNLMKRFSKNKRVVFSNDDSSFSLTMAKTIHQWRENKTTEVVLICIGTDRSTGDSLGPLTGTLLLEQGVKHLTVYGTLENPVHAVNLKETLNHIKEKHPSSFLIAVDACLGKKQSIGQIITGVGSMKPGAALKKDLPEVGDVYISGVVNIGGYMDFLVLQNTRLHQVREMSQKIAKGLTYLDHLLALEIQLQKKQVSTKETP